MSQPRLHAVGDDDLDELRARVRRIADAVGLRQHTFEIRVARLPEGTRATCACEDSRSYSLISLSEGFFELPVEQQDEALIHEVLHPLFHRLMVHVTDLREELSRSHYTTLERVFQRDLELAVDTLTGALAKLLG